MKNHTAEVFLPTLFWKMVKVQIVFSFRGVTSPKHSLTEQHNFPTFYWSRCKAAPSSPSGSGAAAKPVWVRCLQKPPTTGQPALRERRGWGGGRLSRPRPPINALQLFLHLFEKSDLVSIKFPYILEVTCYSFTSLSPQSSFQVSIFCCLA